ncbi:MAG: Lon protease-like protein [Planctomycetota bacterium]|jgi:Lon protease-like protein
MSSSEIPDAWPAPGGNLPPQIVPLFPLPKIFLYPNVMMPLHIFEPRYRQMIDDLLDRRGWLVITPIRSGFEDDSMGNPPVYPVGGLGEIVKHSRLPDGGYLITLAGLGRVRIKEVESDKLYRKVQFEPLQEVQPEGQEDMDLREELRKAILERSDQFLNLPPDLPLAPLADLLLHNLDLPVDSMCDVFGEPVVTRRANFALAEHAARQ